MSGRVQRERVSLRGLRWRWGYNRVLLSVLIVVAAAFCVWRTIDPPRVVIERVPSTVTLDRPAELFAQQFARAYLSYDARDPQQRSEALGRFDDGSGTLSRDYQAPAEGRRSVRSSGVLQAFAVPQGTRYVVAAETSSDGSLYLAVTVERDADGSLSVVGAPALVGPPVSGPAQPEPGGQELDDPDAERVVTRAMRNYLAGADDDLAADLSSEAVVSLPTIALSLERVTQVRWEDGAFQSVLTSVAVRSSTGEQLELTYELALEQRDGRWLVAGIHNNPTGQ